MNTQINKLLGSDHSELDELLSELFSAFEVGSVEQIYQRLDMFWARLAMHIRAEHLHLFPAILGAFERGQTKEAQLIPSLEVVKDKIAALQKDHNFFMRELFSVIKQMRETSENNPADSARLLTVRETIEAVKIRLDAHNESEETEVYKWADVLFEPAVSADLNRKMRKELDNLPPRFGRAKKLF